MLSWVTMTERPVDSLDSGLACILCVQINSKNLPGFQQMECLSWPFITQLLRREIIAPAALT